jgi:DNA-binding CsgD family transcriptional regulator
MSWSELDDEVRELAESALTHRQLETLILALAGYDERSIADTLELSRSTIRDHLYAAHRNLRLAGIRFHPNGAPYIGAPA